MSATLEMYVNRAAECRREAADTRLANVRERYLRSALAWDGMAAQVRVTRHIASLRLLAKRSRA